MSHSEQDRLYEDYVLRNFQEPFHRGVFSAATNRFRVDNPVCGDTVQIELAIGDGGLIQNAWFTGAGCIISQAAASMLVEFAEGKEADAMSKFGAIEMLALFRAPLTSRRQQCCLLAWAALRSAIGTRQVVK